MYITDTQAIAARKTALAFHTKHSIRSLDEIKPHALSWSDLNGVQKDARKAAADALDNITDKSTSEQRASAGEAVDAFSILLDNIRAELDERSVTGSKEPRASAITAAQMARRPGVDAVEVNGGDDASADECYALAPEARFSTWAQARNHDSELRGLSVGNYLRSMIVGAKTDAERRALSAGSDSAGGFTVPDILSATLIDLARAQSVVIRAGAQTVPLTSDTNNMAKLLTDPVPAWRAEAGAVAASDPTFGRVQLIPRSLAVQTVVSAELMEDSVNLATELPRILAAAMAVELDRAALIGTGTAPEPRGIAATAGIGSFAQNATIASFANLSRARTAILTANQSPTAFVMHPRDEGTFTDLVDADGNPLVMPTRLAEIPMYTTTSLPVDGGAGDDESTIIAGDFRRLMVGIRSEIRVEILKTTAYTNNLQYIVLAHLRADVAVTHPGAFFTLTGVGRAA
jgi:HK97 family phage major capsid protein